MFLSQPGPALSSGAEKHVFLRDHLEFSTGKPLNLLATLFCAVGEAYKTSFHSMFPPLAYQLPPQSKQRLFWGQKVKGRPALQGVVLVYSPSSLRCLELCGEHTHAEQEMELFPHMNSGCLPAFQIHRISLSSKMHGVPEARAASVAHVHA